VEDAAAEGPEVLGSAAGVGAADAGDPFAAIPALKEPFDDPNNLLQARVSYPAGAIGLVASGKLGEVAAEQPLQRVRAPLPVGARG
jgi:hypothetical protein